MKIVLYLSGDFTASTKVGTAIKDGYIVRDAFKIHNEEDITELLNRLNPEDEVVLVKTSGVPNGLIQKTIEYYKSEGVELDVSIT